MKELLDKISSYNIFNYLFPGVVFAVIASKLTSYDFVQSDILIGPFVYYFIGAIVSRVGSLVVEPVLKKTRIVSFAPYDDFVRASKEDPKLEVLSETNNMYRIICSLLVCVTVVHVYEKVEKHFEFLKSLSPLIAVAGLLVLFIYSYRKQCAYVKKRVSAHVK